MSEGKTLDQWLYELQAPGRTFTAEDLRMLRDVLALRRRTGREWAQAVAIKPGGDGPQAPPADSDPVTQDEAVLAFLVGMNDLIYEVRNATQDTLAHVLALDLFLEEMLPGYAEWRRSRMTKAIRAAS